MKHTIEKSMLFILGIVGVSLVASLPAPSSAEPKQLPGNAFIVDVRTPLEYRISHYPNASNIPLKELQSRIGEFGDKRRQIVVYCRSGRRSGIAKELLEKSGYTNVINGGGLSAMRRMTVERKVE